MSTIPSSIKHIHLIAACGTGMGSLAGLLKEKGFHISGSDQNIYPPMSAELEKLGITLFSGYKPENLSPKPDLVIIGNAVSKNNPEVDEVIKLRIPYLSMPQALSQFFISGHESIVVAGTHGKTTTSALAAHMLFTLKADPSFFVGGVSLNFQKNYQLGKGKYFIVEGDEYDTAFFDKEAKFLHYQPYYTIITSLEFDHADIYRDLDHLTQSFEKLIRLINPQGHLLACTHYSPLMQIISRSKAPVETYGLENNPHWLASQIRYESDATFFDISYKGKKDFRLRSPLPGRHNILNALAVFALLKKLGYQSTAIQEALSLFQGVKRRQEIRAIINDKIIIDDFAHHPTAVLETIDAIKKRYPSRKLWAVFEPRSNTSKRNIFQQDYVKAFTGADEVILSDVFMPEKVTGGQILDVDLLASEISKQGKPARHISGVDSIVSYLGKVPSPSVILIMSNGGFGGIHEKLIKTLK